MCLLASTLSVAYWCAFLSGQEVLLAGVFRDDLQDLNPFRYACIHVVGLLRPFRVS